MEHERAIGDDHLLGLLDWTPAERERIDRFRHQGAKTSWCLSRWLLREALSETVGIRDANRLLEYAEYGKPFIRACGISFNWSHADGCIALALVEDREIGVDIEELGRQRGDYIDVARSFFKDEEREWIGEEQGDESWKRFLSLFVQKEAWLKATGRGLSLPLSEAPVALELPPARSAGRSLLEIGRHTRYYLAVDASIGRREETPQDREPEQAIDPVPPCSFSIESRIFPA